MKNETAVVENVKYWAKWWILQWKNKLEKELNETISQMKLLLVFFTEEKKT